MRRNSYPWFMFYSSIMHEEQYHNLSDGAFRAYVLILCFMNAQGDDNTGDTNASPERIEWTTRKPITPHIQELTNANLITTTQQGNIHITNWTEENPRNRKPPKY